MTERERERERETGERQRESFVNDDEFGMFVEIMFFLLKMFPG